MIAAFVFVVEFVLTASVARMIFVQANQKSPKKYWSHLKFFHYFVALVRKEASKLKPGVFALSLVKSYPASISSWTID